MTLRPYQETSVVGGMRVQLVPGLEWQIWRLAFQPLPWSIAKPQPTLLVGTESYHQVMYALTVELEVTDPGPLDARVP